MRMASSYLLVAYDRDAVYAIVRTWTPVRLRSELTAWVHEGRLSQRQCAALQAILLAWEQRALGLVPLRDALLVDPQRGASAFNLICAAFTRAQLAATAALAAHLDGPRDVAAVPEPWRDHPDVRTLIERAATDGLTLAVLDASAAYPFPTDLVDLTPPPTGDPYGMVSFEQPQGWRRRIAVLLAVSGMALLVLPILTGQIPEDPAGLPLALMTLALLVGVRAGRAGWLGSLCIWLVANLPGFRYGIAPVALLWPGLPLLIVGLIFLALDRRIRAMWRWLRGQFAG